MASSGFKNDGSDAVMTAEDERAALAARHGIPDTEPEENHGYEYDLIVLGGGSGGLACAKAAADLGKKVAVFDYVKPSPQGTTWGLGGTCVNVGCIPKKLMHTAALLGESVHDAQSYGWEVAPEPKHSWDRLVQSVQDHIHSLNFGYRVQLREKKVTYINAYASFVDPHTVTYRTVAGQEKQITARRFVIAVGGRPKYPDIPGAAEYGISSDDIFSLSRVPGKTLVVGASYVALECAGFLTGIGFETAVMMRSIPLRGFDQDCAARIVEYMKSTNTRFIEGTVPQKVEKLDSGKLQVTYRLSGATHSEEFDTVMFAIGRQAVTDGLNLPSAGVEFNEFNGKIDANEVEQTNVPHIYAIGDVLEGKLELTPVAVQAGKLLAARLFGGASTRMDYTNVPTTVFTPIEYGSVGLSEENALALYGEDNVEIYRNNTSPLEWTITEHRIKGSVYMKLICVKSEDERVVGFHVLGPNAGEITQGFGLALRLNAKKSDFDMLVGIHPTLAEQLTTMAKGVMKDEHACQT